MKLLKGVLAAALALLPIELMAQDSIKIGLFNRDAAIITAVEKGFLKQENIAVEINTVTDSPTLLRNLIKGNYDLILNNADNVIAWAEGQGEDPQKNDFVIFLGGSQGVDQKLVVAPGINDYRRSQGQTSGRRRRHHGLCRGRHRHPEKAWPGMEEGLQDKVLRQHRRARRRHEPGRRGRRDDEHAGRRHRQTRLQNPRALGGLRETLRPRPRCDAAGTGPMPTKSWSCASTAP